MYGILEMVQTATDINPIHTYTDTGSYTVTLIGASSNGCVDTIVKSRYIQIGKPVIAISDLPTNGLCSIDNFSFLNNNGKRTRNRLFMGFW